MRYNWFTKDAAVITAAAAVAFGVGGVVGKVDEADTDRAQLVAARIEDQDGYLKALDVNGAMSCRYTKNTRRFGKTTVAQFFIDVKVDPSKINAPVLYTPGGPSTTLMPGFVIAPRDKHGVESREDGPHLLGLNDLVGAEKPAGTSYRVEVLNVSGTEVVTPVVAVYKYPDEESTPLSGGLLYGQPCTAMGKTGAE